MFLGSTAIGVAVGVGVLVIVAILTGFVLYKRYVYQCFSALFQDKYLLFTHLSSANKTTSKGLFGLKRWS